MNPYDIFSDQLRNYENSVEKIFKTPIAELSIKRKRFMSALSDQFRENVIFST